MAGNDTKPEKGRESGGRGFAGMDEDEQREIAAKGGRAAHEKGTAHEFNEEEAREAGRKGGEARSEAKAAANKGGSSSGERGSSREQHKKAPEQTQKNK